MNFGNFYKQATALAATLLLSLSLGLTDARAQTPAPPKATPYPLVEDLPPPRDQRTMTPDERAKIQKDLTAARDRQTTVGKAKGNAPAKP